MGLTKAEKRPDRGLIEALRCQKWPERGLKESQRGSKEAKKAQ